MPFSPFNPLIPFSPLGPISPLIPFSPFSPFSPGLALPEYKIPLGSILTSPKVVPGGAEV